MLAKQITQPEDRPPTWRRSLVELKTGANDVDPQTRLKINNRLKPARKISTKRFIRSRKKMRQVPGKFSWHTMAAVHGMVESRAFFIGTGDLPGHVEFTLPFLARLVYNKAERFSSKPLPPWSSISNAFMRGVKRALADLHAAGIIIYEPGHGLRYSVVAIPSCFKDNPFARIDLAKKICTNVAYDRILSQLDESILFTIKCKSYAPHNKQRKAESLDRKNVYRACDPVINALEAEKTKAQAQAQRGKGELASFQAMAPERQKTYLEAFPHKAAYLTGTPPKASLYPHSILSNSNELLILNPLTEVRSQLAFLKNQREETLKAVSARYRQEKPIFQQVADLLEPEHLYPMAKWEYHIREPGDKTWGKRRKILLSTFFKSGKRSAPQEAAAPDEVSTSGVDLSNIGKPPKSEPVFATPSDEAEKRLIEGEKLLSEESLAEVRAIRAGRLPTSEPKMPSRPPFDQNAFENKEARSWLEFCLNYGNTPI